MDLGLGGMRMDRNNMKETSRRGSLMDIWLIGMRMDRRKVERTTRRVS